MHGLVHKQRQNEYEQCKKSIGRPDKCSRGNSVALIGCLLVRTASFGQMKLLRFSDILHKKWEERGVLLSIVLLHWYAHLGVCMYVLSKCGCVSICTCKSGLQS